MKNLRSIREQFNLTQRECASALSMPKTTFCYYEQGKVSPSIETLLKIADYFNCSIDYLLGHETQGILHLDSFTPAQQKLIGFVAQLNLEQTNIAIGWFSSMLGLPYSEVKPQKPF